MTNKEEIKFWEKAKKLIQKGYGKEVCEELHFDCASCKAQIAVGWINAHLNLLEWDLEQNGGKKKTKIKV